MLFTKNKLFIVGLFLVQLCFGGDLDSGISVSSGITASSHELTKTMNMTYIKSKIKAKINGGGNDSDLIMDGTNIGGVNMVNSKAKNIYLNTQIDGNALTTGKGKK